MTRKMPADFARCDGILFAGPKQAEDCAVKDQCIRFNSEPHEYPYRQVWLIPDSPCTAFVQDDSKEQ